MHIKKKVIPITTKTSIQQKCGECLHFKNNAKYEKPCSQLGVKRFASAPTCFYPNIYALTTKSPDALYQIGLLLHNFSTSESRILLSLLNQNKTFERSYDLKFGQPVYFKLGADFLVNYFKGYVAGVATAGEQQVFVTSDMGGQQRHKPVIATLLRDSVYSISEFKKKRSQLEKEGRFNDPNPKYTPVAKKVDVKYEIPSMESAPAEWFDSFGARLKSRSKLKKGKDGSLVFKVDQRG